MDAFLKAGSIPACPAKKYQPSQIMIMNIAKIECTRTFPIGKNQTDTITVTIHPTDGNDMAEAAIAEARALLDTVAPVDAVAKTSRKKTIELSGVQAEVPEIQIHLPAADEASPEELTNSYQELPVKATLDADLLEIIKNATNPEHLARIREVNGDEIAAFEELEQAFYEKHMEFANADLIASAGPTEEPSESTTRDIDWFNERSGQTIWMEKTGDVEPDTNYTGLYPMDFTGFAEWSMDLQSKGATFRDLTEEEAAQASVDQEQMEMNAA